MQTTTYQLLYVVIQVLGIIFHRPEQFEALVVFSVLAVGLAAVIFSFWAARAKRVADAAAAAGSPLWGDE